MPRKCSVYGCTTGYVGKKYLSTNGNQNIPVYGFPLRDQNVLNQWLRNIPNANLRKIVTKCMGVCRKHWPADAKFVKSANFLIPAEPPTIFEGIPQSCIGTKRNTTVRSTKALIASRIKQIPPPPKSKDLFTSYKPSVFINKLKENVKVGSLFFESEDKCTLNSRDRVGAIFQFTVFFTFVFSNNVVNKVCIEAYKGVKLFTPTSVKDGCVKSWSELSDFLKELHESLENVDVKTSFLHRQIELLNSASRYLPRYDQDDICQAFSWYAKSRALYIMLRVSYSAICYHIAKHYEEIKKYEGPETYQKIF